VQLDPPGHRRLAFDVRHELQRPFEHEADYWIC
jgi:hypothetical protein